MVVVTLQNFTEKLPSGQITKGQKYFEKGAVKEITEEGPGVWVAEVTGRENYTVEIGLKNKEINRVDCDCPDDSEYCKHIVAVLFALQQELATDNSASKNKTDSQKTNRAASFDSVLNTVSEKELRDFVKKMAARNKEIRNQFMICFELAKQEDSVDKFRNIIRKTAGMYSRGGFIEWRDSKKALQPAMDIMQEAKLNFHKGNFRVTFDASQAVLTEVHEMIGYMDDSNGIAGECLNEAFDFLFQLAHSADVPFALKEQLFAFARKEYEKPEYDAYSFDCTFLDLMIQSAQDMGQQQQALSVIDAGIKTANDEYDRRKLLEARMELLQKMGRTNEAQKIIEENTDITGFREKLIKQHLIQKNYVAAKTLAKEGLKEDKGNRYWGADFLWTEWLLKIALAEKDMQAVRNYCHDLYFKGDMDHKLYLLYKKTFPIGEWPAECKKWIQSFHEKGNISYPEMYALAAIYISEKKPEWLLVLLQKNPGFEFAVFCQPHIINEYPQELMAIYRNALLDFGNKANNRNQYKELGKRLKSIQKLPGGGEMVTGLVRHFLVTYKNRPAMKDEIEGLLSKTGDNKLTMI